MADKTALTPVSMVEWSTRPFEFLVGAHWRVEDIQTSLIAVFVFLTDMDSNANSLFVELINRIAVEVQRTGTLTEAQWRALRNYDLYYRSPDRSTPVQVAWSNMMRDIRTHIPNIRETP